MPGIQARQIRMSIMQFQRSVGTIFSSFTATFSSLEATFSSPRTIFSSLGTTFSPLRTIFSPIGTTFSSLRATFSSLEATFSSRVMTLFFSRSKVFKIAIIKSFGRSRNPFTKGFLVVEDIIFRKRTGIALWRILQYTYELLKIKKMSRIRR
jgi:hypothetical protein